MTNVAIIDLLSKFALCPCVYLFNIKVLESLFLKLINFRTCEIA